MAPGPEEPRADYLRRISAECEFLEGIPLSSRLSRPSRDARGGEELKIRLLDVFVDLEAVAEGDRRAVEGAIEADAMQAERKRPTVCELLADTRHMVLLGQPGSGKTTLIQHIMFCLAEGELQEDASKLEKLKGWPEGWRRLLPLKIVLSELASWIEGSKPTGEKCALLTDYLSHQFRSQGLPDHFRDATLDYLREGRAILFLDGFDEVPVEYCGRIRPMIDDLPMAFPKSPALVTCRIASFEDEPWRLDTAKWKQARLEPWNRDRIWLFIDGWYNQLEPELGDALSLKADLRRAVQGKDLRRMASNPLLLTAMAIAHGSKEGRLPDKRAPLYEELVQLLLWEWDNHRLKTGKRPWRDLLREASVSAGEVKQVLAETAFDAHGKLSPTADGESTAAIPEESLLDRLARLHPGESKQWARQIVHVIQRRSGLLIWDKHGVYRFPHRTFQEYLAASHLAGIGKPFVEETQKKALAGPQWREVVLLAVGCLAHNAYPDVDRPLSLIRELTAAPSEGTDRSELEWRMVRLAGECLREMGVDRLRRDRRRGPEAVEEVRVLLTQLVTTDRLSPRERSEAGSTLGAIGDTRDFGELVTVDGGRFRMRSREKKVGVPHHETVEAFEIGKYPVTNAQYAVFVGEPPHRPPHVWDGDTPPPERLNHPVTEVSWYDAQAYCEWLSGKSGRSFRLPTEEEWEKAAAGEEGREYPWEGGWDPSRCNHWEAGIKGTSPVGIFAAGESPCRCRDMAGNVWEWTVTEVEKGGGRVLRGGSFIGDRDLVGCGARDRYDPDYRLNYIGFRVAASPSKT